MYNHIDNFMKDKLADLLTGFRKNNITQHCLMCMSEMWKDTLEVMFVQCLWTYQRLLTD